MAIKVKLVGSYSRHPQDQKDAVFGLGLYRIGDERLLKDTPAIRGMVAKVAHLVSHEIVAGDAPKRARRKGLPRKAARKDA